ncbi:MAG: hypothetical protein AB7Q97_10310 [Gammaproteobacteria bacterium]
MKKNAVPQLTAAWWKSNQPDGPQSCKGLEKALTEYEIASKRASSGKGAEAVVDALDEVDKAIDKVADEASKLIKSKKKGLDPDDLQYTVDALGKMSRLVADARKTASAAAEKEADEGEDADDEADAPDGLLNDAEAYKKYLVKSLRRCATARLKFAIGLGKKAPDHRMMFHKSKEGRSLSNIIKKETGVQNLTWGVAFATKDEPRILQLQIEGKQLPGMKLKCVRFLKKYKPLPMDNVRLLLEGKEVADLPDPDDTDVDEIDAPAGGLPGLDPKALQQAMNSLTQRITQAVAALPDSKTEILTPVKEFQDHLKSRNLDAAKEVLDTVTGLLDRLFSGIGGDDAARAWSDAAAAWQSAADEVDRQIGALQAALRRSDDEELKEIAEFGLNAVTGNFKVPLLTAIRELNGAGPQQRAKAAEGVQRAAKDFANHIASDPAIDACDRNPFGVAVTIRTTLGPALEQLGAVAGRMTA